MPDIAAWPAWGPPLAWTIGTLVVFWEIGYALSAIVVSCVPRWLPAQRAALVDSVVRVLRRRLPWWSPLIGAWVAGGTHKVAVFPRPILIRR